MDIFNVKRRDLISFEDFVKISENVHKSIDLSNRTKQKDPTLKHYQNEINRDIIFSHDAFDSTYNMLEKSKKPK